MFRLIPNEPKFFELFDAQAAHNIEAAKVFKELVENWAQDSPAFKQLEDIEHEADITTHEIYDKLNRTFVTPLDREDIHTLASELDNIVDILQSVSSRMQLYRITKMAEDLAPLAQILCDSTVVVRKALHEMSSGGRSRRVQDYCIEINRLENAGDRALDSALSRLFEGRPDPLEVLKWKEVYEGIERAIDKCEDVANVIDGILVKNA